MTRMRETAGQDGFSLVELLVVVTMMSIIGAAILGVVVTTSRTQTFTSDLRQVMDDGRTSLDRIRKEVRAARLIIEEETDANDVMFWLDRDQDSIRDAWEIICYRTEAVSGTTDRWRLVRYGQEPPSTTPITTCSSGQPTNASGQVLAQTLRSATAGEPAIFTFLPDPDPGTTAVELPDPNDDVVPSVLTVEFIFDVRTTNRGPDALELAATIRLRNVA